jgi:N-dimethylarginine dimethylaminohydrolase
MALVNYQNEYAQLKKVALYRPALDEIDQQDPATSMYIERPEPQQVLEEFDGIADKLRELGVEVIVLQPKVEMATTSNMIFLRDVTFVFQDKLLLANMKYPVRQPEPQKFRELLTASDARFDEHFLNLDPAITMEGADIFALNKNLLYTYTGSRTSVETVASLSRTFGVHVEFINANIHSVPQHILGGVHILDENLASRRVRYCSDVMEGYNFIDFDEDDEISKGFALNIVTISPREILMPANNPNTKKKLENNGILCHEIPVKEIHKMGGGLACMVLPLWRINVC